MYPIIIPQIWWFKQLQSNLYLLAKPYRLHIPFRELFNPSLRRRLARNECWRHEHVIVLSPPDTGLDGCLDPMPVMFRINIDWYNPIPRSFLKNHGEWSQIWVNPVLNHGFRGVFSNFNMNGEGIKWAGRKCQLAKLELNLTYCIFTDWAVGKNGGFAHKNMGLDNQHQVFVRSGDGCHVWPTLEECKQPKEHLSSQNMQEWDPA